jgi:hypothetical protein
VEVDEDLFGCTWPWPPQTICNVGFGAGAMAPGRCSNRTTCPEGNSTTEPQVCAYHTLLAHAAVSHRSLSAENACVANHNHETQSAMICINAVCFSNLAHVNQVLGLCFSDSGA